MAQDDRYRSRKWRGLWMAVGLVILVRAGEAFARLKWPVFTLGDLPWLIFAAYGAYAGFNVGTHWAGRTANHKPVTPTTPVTPVTPATPAPRKRRKRRKENKT